MRITGLRVDGYGLLSDLEMGPLHPGLSVIIGPNEAGKSTLLDFLRGVLFGFPDRRHRSHFHEPLRGGRHGGALRLEDSNGSPWLLERHLDRRQPLLSGPDGELRDEVALRDLLGGADEALFRSVFAFGLGELANFESLDKDEVRELVFSAGVLGAGRSATRALRSLEQQRSTLVRPRQQDALANQLRRQLDELDQRLREARALSASYDATRSQCEHLVAQSRAARRETERLHRRARELERLESCWAPWRQREEAAEALRGLGELPEALAVVADASREIEVLLGELSGHEERCREARKLEAQHAGIERELELRLAEIGFDPTTRVLPPLDIGLEEQVGELANRQREVEASRQTLRAELAAVDRDLLSAGEELAREEARGTARDEAALAQAERDLRELRGVLVALDRLQAEEAARRHEAALARIASGRRRTPLLAMVASLIALAATVALLVSLGHHDTALPIVVTSGVALVALLVLARSLHREVPTATEGAVAPSDLNEHSLRLTAKSVALAEGLGLPARPEDAELEAHAAALENEREHRRRLDERARALDAASRRQQAVAERLARLSESATSLREEVRRIAEKLDLSPKLSPEGLCRAVDALREAYRLIAASARVAPELASLLEATGRYEADLGTLLEGLGVPAPGGGQLAESVAVLANQLEQALAGRERRVELAREVASAERLLEESLGSGADAQRLRNELRSGTVLQWAEEHRRLEGLLAEADADYDARLSAQHDAERALRDLLGSQEIASLELEREGIAAELNSTLERWLELGLAGALLDSTLAHYEAERQPVVISRAAALFSEVTGGRYVKLVAREEADQRRHGIDAIAASGERVDAGDLSRGTAEQLYLCLRLAFASTFAERGAALPLVLDDVLVNFDPERAAQMARAITTVAAEHQVIVFTCHPHVLDCFETTGAALEVIELARREPLAAPTPPPR